MSASNLPPLCPTTWWHTHPELRFSAARITHIECFHRSAKAFEDELACKFNIRECFDGAEHINVDQNMSIFSLIAKSGGKIRYLASN
jgi:hypothetical protein